ncbi:uncharacterized protein IUM83_06092 [Phytophthora cinnamomi]|uniref:uncharacterized protein n=1 Tax=Phytophthora cinnamomi TaxID=4785 RepID=UPI003559F118|nr:hypothetical protein IUM83_06092 [Phytophthora cinnamomi]
MFEPSVPIYSVDNLLWTPMTADWCTEVTELDGHEPWRYGWVDVPMAHPYNTIFAPCNPAVPVFVPRGMTLQQAASAVTVDPSLGFKLVTAPWVWKFTRFHDSPATRASAEADDSAAEGSEAEEEESVRSHGGASTERSAQGSVEEAADAHGGRADEAPAATPRSEARAVPSAEHSSDEDFDDERAAGGSAPEAGGRRLNPEPGSPKRRASRYSLGSPPNSDP